MFSNKSQDKDVLAQAQPLLSRASEQASALTHRGVDSVLDMTHLIRNKALRASDDTVDYIKDEPVKAMLIAAVAGAALMAVVSLFSRSRDRR